MSIDHHLWLTIFTIASCTGLIGWLAVKAYRQGAQLELLHDLLANSQGGIYRQIDAHREIAGVLLKEAPGVLDRHRWMKDRLLAQDQFLLGLSESLPARNVVAEIVGRPYPRPWPVVSCKPATGVQEPNGRLARSDLHRSVTVDGATFVVTDGSLQPDKPGDWPAGFVAFS